MGMFDAIDVSASGLTAERLRMDVTAENLANAQTTRTPEGGPYRRKTVVLQQAGSGFAGQLAGAAGSTPEPAGSKRPASSPTRRRCAASTTRGTPTPTRRAT